MKIAKRLLALALCLFALLPPSILASAPRGSYTLCAGGSAHSLAVDKSGNAWVWGENTLGQLGLGAAVQSVSTPQLLLGLSQIVEVTAGYTFSAALDASGFVYLWGQAATGEPIWSPKRVTGLSDILAISAGQHRLLALSKAGLVYECLPGGGEQQIKLPEKIVKVSAGGDFYLALGLSGKVYAWGSNSRGQLMRENMHSSTLPIALTRLGKSVDIAAGYTHALALEEDGSIWAWGSNEQGELGAPLSIAHSPIPLRLGRDTGASRVQYSSIAAGYACSLAITKEKHVQAWGYGEYGQLGNGTQLSSVQPTGAGGLSGVTQISAGVYHNLAVDGKGKLYAWGRNKASQLGNGRQESASTAQQVLSELPGGKHNENAVTRTASAWAIPELDALHARALVPGYAWDGYEKPMTRGEFVAILVDVYEAVREESVPPAREAKFLDTASTPYHLKIQKALSLKLVSGKTESSFAPQGSITRQEAAKLLSLFSLSVRGLTHDFKERELAGISDADALSDWAVPYVSFALTRGMMKGDSTGAFSPLATLSKQELLLVLGRMKL